MFRWSPSGQLVSKNFCRSSKHIFLLSPAVFLLNVFFVFETLVFRRPNGSVNGVSGKFVIKNGSQKSNKIYETSKKRFSGNSGRMDLLTPVQKKVSPAAFWLARKTSALFAKKCPFLDFFEI